MRIKTQVTISLILFILLAIVIILSVFSSNTQLHAIQKKQQIIDDIGESSFDLYYLENDYIIHGGPRPVERWNSKYDEMTGNLRALTVSDLSQQAILNEMMGSQRDMNASFSHLVAVTGGVYGEQPIGSSQELKEISASTLAGQTQTLMSRSKELSQLAKTEALEVERRNTLVVSFSIAVLILFVLLNYFVINRSLLKRISVLQEGAERIGSGDLDTKIETEGNDELGYLSLTFNEMSTRLKNARNLLLASNNELKQENTERKRAENNLVRVNRKLSILNDLTRRDLTNEVFLLKSHLELIKQEAAGHDPILTCIQKIEPGIQSISEITEFSGDYQDMGKNPPKWQNVKLTLLYGLSHVSPGEIRSEIEVEDLEIFADPLLEKAFQGLFENSITHGTHVSTIRVSYRVTPDKATIIFEDDGTGIPSEKKEQIFLRSDGNHSRIRGLFFVREILDLTEITIRETGEPGKGVRFEITVPKGVFREEAGS